MASSIQQTADNGYIIAGIADLYDFNIENYDDTPNILYNHIYVIKTDANGNVQKDNKDEEGEKETVPETSLNFPSNGCFICGITLKAIKSE